MMNSWRPSTLNQYKVYLNKWIAYCNTQKIDPLKSNSISGLEFLRILFKQGLSYSAINSARSALSCIFYCPPFGESPLVIKFMRSIYNCRPSRPRYDKTWDVSLVLKTLEKWSPGLLLSRRDITMKLATLLALVSGQRIQTIHALDINFLHVDHKCVTFTINKLMKQNSANNKTGNQIIIPKYEKNKKICPVVCLNQYLERTKKERKHSQLFLSVQKPYGAVSKSTIARWIKHTLEISGVDISTYKAHSTRAASSSAAAKSVDVALIMKAAGWTRASTFGTFYHKNIKNDRAAFGEAVLNSSSLH